MVEYNFSRLGFKADVIEPLKEDDSFVVHTPNGTFRFTKAEFYRVFSNVIETESYQKGRLYHYPHTPKKAMQFLISGQYIKSDHYTRRTRPVKPAPAKGGKDLVGDDVREKSTSLRH